MAEDASGEETVNSKAGLNPVYLGKCTRTWVVSSGETGVL